MSQTILKLDIKPAYRIFLLAFLLLLLPLTVLLALSSQEIRKQAFAEKKASLPTQSPFQAKYASGEVLVKFNKTINISTALQSKKKFNVNALEKNPETRQLASFLKRQQVISLEKVFKGSTNPQTDTKKFKQRFPERKINASALAKTDLSRTYRLKIPKEINVLDKVRELSNSELIKYAAPNHIYRAHKTYNDPYYLDPNPPAPERELDTSNGGWNPLKTDNSPLDYQWNLKKIKLEEALNYAGTQETTVAVIDTGVDYNHEELAGKIWENQGEIGTDNQGNDKKTNGIDDDNNGYIDDWRGWDAVYYFWDSCDGWGCYEFKYPDNNPMDDWREPYFPSNSYLNPSGGGHGTHVSGIITANNNNNIGIVGINPSAKIMALRALDASGSGFADDLAEMIDYAATNGARVINMSWGLQASNPAIAEALDRAYALGVILVSSAGNASQSVGFPASHPAVIAVSATNEEDRLARYSNYGSKISVAAPGSEGSNSGPYSPRSILSLRGENTDIYCPYDTPCWNGQKKNTNNIVGQDKKYYRAAGTSMASPHVAGLASLILSTNPSLTNEQVRTIIEYSADDLGSPGKDNKFGYGRINAKQAIKELSTNPPPVALISDPYGQEHLYNKTFEITGTALSDQYDSHRIEYAPFDNPKNWSSAGIDLASSSPHGIENGLLGTWNSGTLEGKYYLRLTVVDKEGRERTDQLIIELVNQSLKDGWPKKFDYSHPSDPVVADLDNDNQQEIITTSQNQVFAYKANGDLLKKWNTTVSPSYIAVGEINPSSPGKEIVIGHTTLNILNMDGTINTLQTNGYYQGTLGDLDQNGTDEILAIEVTSNPRQWKLHALDSEGNDLLGFPVIFNDGYHNLPYGPSIIRVGNINQDKTTDVVINLISQNQTTDNRIVAISGDGRILWTKILHTGYGQQNPGFLLADIDLDNSQEIIFNNPHTLSTDPWNKFELYVWKGNGEGFFSTNPLDLAEIGFGSISVANLDEDDNPEFLIGTYSKYAVVDNDGTISINSWPDVKVKPGGSKTMIGDLDDNGSVEFLSFDQAYMLPEGEWPQITNLLFAITEYVNGNFTVKPGWPKSIIADLWGTGSGGYVQSPVLADLDNDQKSDFILQYCLDRKPACYLYVFETNTQLGAIDWPQYLHDERHTGAYTTSSNCTDKTDINCDGSIDIEDLKQWRAGWVSGDKDRADFDNNGYINILDYLRLLHSWLR